ncbi:MAG: aminotransferase class IV [Actinomycetota bacterium]|nr:aminotransferase class IV [Actinomycetota bacterium]
MAWNGALISINGEISPPGEAMLPLPDDGLFRGDGVFEVMRVYAGRPFAFPEHLDRMERSGAVIELAVDRPAIEADADLLLRRFGSGDCLLRLISTRQGNRIASIEPLPEHTPAITLATVTCSPTVILNGVKSLSYAMNMQATRMARAAGAAEALLVRPDGILLEAPTSTIFWVKCDGALRTTALEAGVLDSITRRKLIERLEVEEGEFPLEDLLGAREAFLASTTREVQPVESVDGHRFDLEDTPMARAARAAFAAALADAGIPRP